MQARQVPCLTSYGEPDKVQVRPSSVPFQQNLTAKRDWVVRKEPRLHLIYVMTDTDKK